MRTLTLSEAVDEIKQQSEEHTEAPPFFVIVGAGISVPSVPLSSEISSKCRKLAEERNRRGDPPDPGDPMATYSYWFQKAFPHRDGRRRYLEDLIRGKPVTPANLRLAHLLGSGVVGRLAITPNFDDLLLKALSLIGYPTVVCDHPLTIERIDPARHNVLQVVFVHGNYWFYDCSNLATEIRSHARPTQDPMAGMSSLLDDVMRRLSPIVVGYSGWDGDVIMTSLRRRLTRPLGHNVYWFCHTRHSSEALPAWLRNSDDVCLVFGAPVGADRQAATEAGERTAKSATSAAMARELGKAGREELASPKSDALEAVEVFDALIAAFKIPAPELTLDPLGFFAQRLRDELYREAASSGPNDLYGIASVVARVEHARKLLRDESQQRAALLELEPFRDAIRRSDYAGAVSCLARVDATAITQAEVQSIAGQLGTIIDWLRSELKLDELESLEETIQSWTTKFGTVVVTHLLYTIRIAEAKILRSRKEPQRAIEKLDFVINSVKSGEDRILDYDRAVAISRKADLFDDLGRYNDELTLLDDIISSHENSTDPDISKLVAFARVDRANTLDQLGEHSRALRAFDEVVEKYRTAERPVIRGCALWALSFKAFAQSSQGSSAGAIETLEQLRALYRNSPIPNLRVSYSRWLAFLADLLMGGNRYKDAIGAADEALTIIDPKENEDSLRLFYDALITKATALTQVGKHSDATQALNQLRDSLKDRNDHVSRELSQKLKRFREKLRPSKRPTNGDIH